MPVIGPPYNPYTPYSALDSGPGPGGSPAQMVSWAFNQAWNIAAAKSTASDATFLAAQSGFSSPNVSPANFSFTPNVVEPIVNIPQQAQGASIAEFYQIATAVINQLAGLFADYIADYFPGSISLYDETRDWLFNAIQNGGTGIHASVEDQIWQRDRARVIAESERAEDELLTAWAGRGYTIPPGSLIYGMQQVQKEAADRISQASRDVAVKQAEMEVENVRFAIGNAKELYLGSLGAAADYIRALSIGPSSAQAIIPSITDSQARLIQAANSYYQSRIGVEELKLKASMPPAEYDQAARMKNGDLQMAEIDARIRAAIAAAQSMGTQAAAALNGLHASASTSGSASNSVGYSYSNDTLTAPSSVTSV